MRINLVFAQTAVAVSLVSSVAFAQDATEEPAASAEPAAEAPAEPSAAPAAADTASTASASTDSGGASGKFVLGLRLGYGIPLGDGAKDAKMSDVVSGQIPIWLDLGYMVTPNVMVGLYGQYGFGLLSSDLSNACQGGVSCSITDYRLGVQGQYHISPAEKMDPWLGLGVGYEWFKLSASGGGQSDSATAKGLEFLNLQGGLDFKLSPAFGLGPFLSFSLGQFSSNTSGDIRNKAMHEWLTIGAHGAFNL